MGHMSPDAWEALAGVCAGALLVLALMLMAGE